MAGHTLMTQVLVAAASLTVATVRAQDLVFAMTSPSDTCTLDTGDEGRCLDIRSCPPVRQTIREKRPVVCGFNGTFPVVCCPAPVEKPEVVTEKPEVVTEKPEVVTEKPEVVTEPSLDFSRPAMSFVCGVSRPRVVSLPPGTSRTPSPGEILRPGHDLRRVRRRRGASRPTPAGRRLPVPLPGTGTGIGIGIGINQPTVVGGETASINAWPWMALLGEEKKGSITWFCAGALINEQWVLTAYHCFQHTDINIVRLGEHDYNNDKDKARHEDLGVVETVLYPEFTFPAAYHDLALLKLDRKVKIQRYIRPVCLPWGREANTRLVNKQVTLTGWGNTQFGGSPSSVLQQVDVTVFSSSNCDRSYSDLPDYSSAWPQGIGEETLCAGDKSGGRDACQGDSGGPVVSKNSAGRYIVAGIVSRGYGCGHRKYPGLYVNLRHPPYLSWIKRVAFQ